MNGIIFVVLFIFVIVVGNILGAIMQSYSIKSLKSVRRIAYIMPLLEISFLFHLIFTKDENKLRLIMIFLLMRNKHVVFAQCLALVIENYMATHPQASWAKTRRYVAAAMPIRVSQYIGSTICA